MRKEIIVIIVFSFLISLSYSQPLSITWQKCIGTDVDDEPRCICKTEDGSLLSVSIFKEYEGIPDFHGGADALIIKTDTLGNIIWQRCYGGSYGEGIRKIIDIPNRGYYLIGGTDSRDGDVQSNTHQSYEVWIIEIDTIGNIIWENCYGSYEHDSFVDATLTPDDGLIVGSMVTTAGGDISTFYGSRDVWIFRIDSTGNLIWEKSFGNHGLNRISSLISTSDSTYIFLGAFHEFGGMIDCYKDESSMETDVWLVEFDQSGELIYQNCYGGSYYEDGYAITEVEGGFIFNATTSSNDQDVSGYHGTPGDTKKDIWLVQIDINKNIIWQNCYGGTLTDVPNNIYHSKNQTTVFGWACSNDGNVIGNHSTNGKPDIWIFNIDSIGNIQWQQCIGGIGWEQMPRHGVTIIGENHYGILGRTNYLSGDVECEIYENPPGYPDRDAWLINLRDCNYYAPHQPQQPTGKDTLCVNTDSITIYSTQIANGAWFYEWQLQPEEAGIIINDSTIKTTIHWNPTYEGPAILKVRSSNDCGESTWSDSLVVQTYMCLGTEENSIANNLHIYPNPATSTLIVEIDSADQNPSLLEIYNSTSARVYSSKTNNKSTVIDISDWNSGIYIVKVIIGNENYNRKVVVK